MQVYTGLNKITNKHPLHERDGVPHHVMDHIPWNETYFIHKFAQEAQKAIDDIHLRNKIPIIIGGTHYYLSKLLFTNKTIGDVDEIETSPNLTAEQISILDGPTPILFETLKSLDAKIAEKFHPQDTRKLRRALEIIYLQGDKVSSIYQSQKDQELKSSSLKYNLVLFWIYSDIDILKVRLDDRVDKMMESSGLDEIKEMYDVYDMTKPDITSGIWQVIGFKEFLPWLKQRDNKKLYQEALERMKTRTRQYAKYQIKWIKNTLFVELEKESRFEFVNGGKLYLLDATDLIKWNENVLDVGINITKKFMTGEDVNYELPQHLKDIFPNQKYLEERASNKKLGSEVNWKHYSCEHCKDKQGNPFVAVGEESWNIHITGRRHKRSVGSIERKRKHQEMIAQYKSSQ